MSDAPTRRDRVAVVLLALLLLGIGIDHGLPFRFVPDAHVVRGALGMAQDRDLAPPAGTYTSYPYLLPYLLLPAYAALYAGGRATGAWPDAATFGARMGVDPTPVVLVARGLIVAFGALAALLALVLGGRLLGRRGGLVAAWLVATSFSVVHLGHGERPWVPLTAWVLLAAERSLAWQRAPGWGRAAGAGLACGLAFATHQVGGLALLLPAGAALARLAVAPGRAIRDGVVVLAAFVPTALLLGVPYVLFGHGADVPVDSAGDAEVSFSIGGQSFAAEKLGLARTVDTLAAFASAEPALVALALLGLLALPAAWRERRGELLTLGLYPLVHGGIFLFYAGTHVRYLVPLVPFLALAGAAGAARLARGTAGRVVLVLLLAVPLVQASRLDLLMTRPDTRAIFQDAVAAHVPEGATIAVEGYGPPLRATPAALDALAAEGRPVYARERREALATDGDAGGRRPAYALLPLERFYRSEDARPDDWIPAAGAPPESLPIERFLAERGVDFVITAQRRPAATHAGGTAVSALDEWLRSNATVVATADPSAARAGPAHEAFLPADPRRPLRALWEVERTGPRLTLWRLE